MSIVGRLLIIAAMGMMDAAAPHPPAAQNDEFYKNQVLRYVQESRYVGDAQKLGFRTLDNGLKWGYVRVGKDQFQDAEYDLRFGFYYAFVAACDSDCRDIDLALIDPDGNVVATDRDSDDMPVLLFAPAKPGRYRIRATVPGCGAIIGCYWAVQQLGK
jgi:hypothetical protein